RPQVPRPSWRRHRERPCPGHLSRPRPLLGRDLRRGAAGDARAEEEKGRSGGMMTTLVTLFAAALTSLTSVKGVSVVPVDDRTEVVIEVDGPVSVEHFILGNPDRLVVDLTPA